MLQNSRKKVVQKEKCENGAIRYFAQVERLRRAGVPHSDAMVAAVAQQESQRMENQPIGDFRLYS